MANIISQHPSNKIAVITAITGDKDYILDAPNFKNADSYLFTDKLVMHAKGWRIHYLPKFSNLNRSDRRNAKLPKILPFFLLPQYDFIIWQDGGHMIQVDPVSLVQKYLIDQKKDIAAFRHGKVFNGEDHNCVYKEADNIYQIGFLEEPEILGEQVKAYLKEGYPENYGLSCNSAMIWRKNDNVQGLQLAWWEQICRYSSRDQMSFFYSLWKTGMKDRLTYIDGHWERNSEIPRVRGHLDPKK